MKTAPACRINQIAGIMLRMILKLKSLYIVGSSRTQAPSQVALPRMVNAPSVKVAAPKPAGKLLKRQRDDLTKVWILNNAIILIF